jgi:hypothetical protein
VTGPAADPLGVDPVRRECRGDFPAHTDLPGRRVIPLAEAKRLARQRLDDWKAAHRGERH